MNKQDLRKKFTEYFKSHGHEHVASSSLVPADDPTLLFNNAGMNQFKNVFTGLEKRSYTKATSVQKCVRAGGKHNDLDNVGFTARHHTFFEMLGNFSFGDYFKKEAIHYAWDFLTNELKLPKDKLYVTVFETDDEAFNIWRDQEKVAEDRIYRFGEKDNFWRMGKTGPCGPCSEIFFDQGPEVGGDPKENVMGGEGDRFIEVWNLVFMQFNEDEQGNLNPLPKPSVDTGAGIERLTAILQKEISNYHTDDFLDIIRTAENIGDVRYEKVSKDKKQNEINVALRVLADHARTTAFLIADGVLPSNEGRGYVLRRIMRRAIRYGRNLNPEKSFLPKVVETVIQKMGEFYPELNHAKDQILSNTVEEEERFLKTLDQGTDILNNELKKVKNGKLSGQVAFKLYDTYGFPFDLTELMAGEKNITVSEEEFNTHMEAAKEKARASWKGEGLSNNKAHLISSAQKIAADFGPTKFEGYNFNLQSKSKAVFLSNGETEVESLKEGESGLIVFESTCFYAEGGGQAGDLGTISDGDNQAEVVDCTKQGDIFFLSIKVTDGTLTKSEILSQTVHTSERRKTTQHHSATHLLHAALRQVLGEHITQAGSSVDHTRLRFDYTHKGPMTPEEIKKVEDLVNEQIDNAIPVTKELMSHKEALAKGALALFGEKYGDEVRVLSMGEFSTELCGGTHVSNTSEIRAFKITSETGVSSGVRRIEALAGQVAIDKLNQTITDTKNELNEQATKFEQKIKDLEKKFQSMQGQQVDINSLVENGIAFDEGKLVIADVEMDDRKFLSTLSDKLVQKVQSGIVVVIGKGEKSNPIIVAVTKNLNPKRHAGNILKAVATELGGKGGGRPDFAQGAAPNRDIKAATEVITAQL